MRIFSVSVLIVLFVFGTHIPSHFGFEGGFFETVQIILLLAGAAISASFFYQQRDQSKWFLAAITIIWIIMVGRELSWGAIFLEPHSITAQGPQFSSSHLPYRDKVNVILVALLFCAISCFVKSAAHRMIIESWKEKRFPFLDIAGFVLAMLVAAIGEGNIFNLQIENAQIFDEAAETAAYAFLLSARLHFLNLKIKFIHQAVQKNTQSQNG